MWVELVHDWTRGVGRDENANWCCRLPVVHTHTHTYMRVRASYSSVRRILSGKILIIDGYILIQHMELARVSHFYPYPCL